MTKHCFPFIISPVARRTKHKPDKKIEEHLNNIIGLINEIIHKIDKQYRQNLNEDPVLKFFQELLPVLDNLDAFKNAIDETLDEEWKKGMKFFYDRLYKLFYSYGLSPTAIPGEKFNPDLHEAVGVDNSSGLSFGNIVEVIESGWSYKKKVLRFAKVVVAK